MAVKIRLRRQGRKNRPFFRLVAAQDRAKRDDKYFEALGWYAPQASNDEDKAQIIPDRIDYWVGVGAQVTEKALCVIKQRSPELYLKIKKRK